jgi:hypothetical protein
MTNPELRPIILFNHPKDKIQAMALRAALNLVIDTGACEIWHRGEDETAMADLPTQIQDGLKAAIAVIFVIGPEGTNDAALRGPEGSLIWERRATANRDFGRLVVRLPNAPERDKFPSGLEGWVHVDVTETTDFGPVAAEIMKKITIPTKFRELAVDEGAKLLPEGSERALVEQFELTAQLISSGKPITLMLGPYASADGEDDHSCPSYIRRELLGLISDPELRRILVPPKADPAAPDQAPILWQDHLATICLLGGSSREEVIDVISRSVREAAGDAKGPPRGLFKSIAALATLMKLRGMLKAKGVPGITIISVCPGLRVERALVAAKCEFERVTLLFGTDKGVDLHRYAYRPTLEHSKQAQSGGGLFMPDPAAAKTDDQLDFIRVVKPFGSWDLDPGVPSGDLGQAYDALGQLKSRLDALVSAAASGPYVVLGGGLGTPPIQAVHALLLRDALEQPERRPLLAIAPAKSISPDPLRQLETNRIKGVGGPRKLKILSSDPVRFVDALTVAFGGEPPARVNEMPAPPPQPVAPASAAE